LSVAKAVARLIVAALGLAAGAEAQQDIGWPEAVARLAAERQRAVTCAGLARTLPTGDALGSAYGEAKAEMDGVVSGLAVALAQGLDRTVPRAALPDLEYRMGAGFAKRDAFCRRVLDLSPPTPSGQRSLVGDLVGGLAKPLIEAVVAIWTRADDNDRLRRDTIRAQLEATRWPTYVDVPPVH
jgi:hypothetical protein